MMQLTEERGMSSRVEETNKERTLAGRNYNQVVASDKALRVEIAGGRVIFSSIAQ